MTDIHYKPHSKTGMSNKNSGSKINPAMKRSAEDDDSSSDKETNQQKKIVFGLNKKEKSLGLPQKKKVMSSISIKLGGPAKSAVSSAPTLKPKVGTAALVFTEDDEDSEEEMPPEAKMRMKNIGRDTPTSSGPNSFGKSRMGFCDSKKMYERKLREIQDQLEDE